MGSLQLKWANIDYVISFNAASSIKFVATTGKWLREHEMEVSFNAASSIKFVATFEEQDDVMAVLVSMPQAALSSLQLKRNGIIFNLSDSFNAASSIKFVATEPKRTFKSLSNVSMPQAALSSLQLYPL